MTIVQFNPFSSLVQPSFWHELTKLKIDVLRLSDEPVPIHGTYTTGKSIKDRETGQEISLGCNLSVGAESFDEASQHASSSGTTTASGFLKNFNTIEEFKETNKTELFNHELDKIWESIIQRRDTSLLNRFFLITYADLKKYKYYYWFAFPVFVSKPAWEISDDGWRPATERYTPSILSSIHAQLRDQHNPPFFIVRLEGDTPKLVSLDKFDETSSEEQTIGFIDPSPLADNPGWPLRNVLAYLRALYPEQSTKVQVLRWSDAEAPSEGSGHPWKSTFGALSIAPTTEQQTAVQTRPSGVGWEKNNQGKLAPRMADLAPMMDPTRLAEQAVDLNLKLMRWRILPSLDLEKVSGTKCLLLGAGTLGCYVARTLMGWGVRTITFVDSARVSFSNPVRQPLFEFEDCVGGGKPKAACAADRMKKIYPGINASGHTLSIPMPGHPIPPASVEQTKQDVKTLEKLFDEHDVVFLLMDSRESRWLPTVMGAAKGKIVLNAALGFDTFLVMRHGARAASDNGKRLGCYYCNDIVAPADSLTDRTLDQMCTVTRPGLASIAASTAVELLVSLLQHPEGVRAPAPPPQTTNVQAGDDISSVEGTSVLGLVPHQLRGFLAQFRNLHIVGAAYDKCTGCSETVINAYEKEGFDMLLQAFNDQKYLERLTGLEKMYNDTQAAMESGDWDVEEGGDDDDF